MNIHPYTCCTHDLIPMFPSYLPRLESRMQSRKVSLATGGGGWNSSYAENAPTGEDRKWVSHVQSLAHLSSLSNTSGKEGSMSKGLGSSSLTSMLLQAAAKNISRESTAITVQVVRVMLEECPEKILSLSHSLTTAPPGSDAESYAEMPCEAPNATRDFLSFMQMVLSVLLHGISGNQSVDSFLRLFECSCFVIKKFGFRLFLTAVGDSLQVGRSIHTDCRRNYYFFHLYVIFLSVIVHHALSYVHHLQRLTY